MSSKNSIVTSVQRKDGETEKLELSEKHIEIISELATYSELTAKQVVKGLVWMATDAPGRVVVEERKKAPWLDSYQKAVDYILDSYLVDPPAFKEIYRLCFLSYKERGILGDGDDDSKQTKKIYIGERRS